VAQRDVEPPSPGRLAYNWPRSRRAPPGRSTGCRG
jgi:hypothetical protein